jgi:hypothetical protein
MEESPSIKEALRCLDLDVPEAADDAARMAI